MPRPTTPEATIGSGWSSGIAAQVSLPNMLALSCDADCGVDLGVARRG